jgi:guanylate cyclase soluble subunit beta
MYGMIHQAARQMVIDRFGTDMWSSISGDMRLTESHFIGSTVYDDEVTLDLVAAIARKADVSIPDALELFGEYWIEYARDGSFRNLMRMAGSDLLEFVGNLDRMHSSIQVTLTNAKLPTFELVSADTSEIRLIYRSKRVGLDPFVKGLMQGLMRHFNTTGHVVLTPRNDASLDILIQLA